MTSILCKMSVSSCQQKNSMQNTFSKPFLQNIALCIAIVMPLCVIFRQ